MELIDKDMLSISAKELLTKSKMRFQYLETKEDIYETFAEDIINEIKRNNQLGINTKLILPVGPKGQYPILISRCNQEKINWKNVFVFIMDEYLDWQGRVIPENHPLSFRGYMKQMFSKLNEDLQLPEENFFCPDPTNIDYYSDTISRLGGIDICYGGIGCHGHIAFNEPPNSRLFKVSINNFKNSLTRIVSLAPETVVMNSVRANGGNFYDFPPMAITVGMKDILSAKKIRLYCDGGDWQRFALRMALLGNISIEYPVTLVQEHQDVKIIADKVTAKPLEY